MASAGKQTPIIRKFIDWLALRPVKEALRLPTDLVPRSMPPPDLPAGPTHKLSANYYLARDARRENSPPVQVYTGSSQKALDAAQSTSKKAAKAPRLPGFGYDIDGQGYYGPK